MRMYHGTTKSSYESIINDGKIFGDVYLTPDFETAAHYASNNSSDYFVIAIDVDSSEFNYDHEFVKGELEDRIEESLKNGSVIVERDILVSEFVSVVEFEDFEEVE